MKFSTAVDVLAGLGLVLIGAAAYRYDPRLLLLFAGLIALLVAGILSRVEGRWQAARAAAEKNFEV